MFIEQGVRRFGQAIMLHRLDKAGAELHDTTMDAVAEGLRSLPRQRLLSRRGLLVGVGGITAASAAIATASGVAPLVDFAKGALSEIFRTTNFYQQQADRLYREGTVEVIPEVVVTQTFSTVRGPQSEIQGATLRAAPFEDPNNSVGGEQILPRGFRIDGGSYLIQGSPAGPSRDSRWLTVKLDRILPRLPLKTQQAIRARYPKLRYAFLNFDNIDPAQQAEIASQFQRFPLIKLSRFVDSP